MSAPRYRVAKSTPEEIQTGATFAPGEEAVGIDPAAPEVARKIEEGRFVEIQEEAPRKPKAGAKKAGDNEEESK